MEDVYDLKLQPPAVVLVDVEAPCGLKQRVESELQEDSELLYVSEKLDAASPSGIVLHIPLDTPVLLHKLEAYDATRTSALDAICGASCAVTAFKEKLAAVAQSDTPVLLLGASGSGKSLGAKAIHLLSPRKNAAFYAVNVATIPEYLAESELFGAVRGAFTDAAARKGYFSAASGGTLFLDEIGELSLAIQAKLLHVLENGTYRNVGSDVLQKSNVRLIFATNVDLKRKVKLQQFRKDLYYRISKLVIQVPSLKERVEDIPLLSRHFLADKGKRLTTNAERLLCTFQWEGNVRQLYNCLERAAVYSKGALIDVDDIELD